DLKFWQFRQFPILAILPTILLPPRPSFIVPLCLPLSPTGRMPHTRSRVSPGREGSYERIREFNAIIEPAALFRQRVFVLAGKKRDKTMSSTVTRKMAGATGARAQKQIALLGCGKMGGILLQAFLDRKLVSAEEVAATVQHEEKARSLSGDLA